MNGFVSVHKDQGMSSFDVIRRLRRLLPGVKMGHAGTLDPMASGVLPVALGKATRLLEYVSPEPKVYRATMILGLTSDTQDIWGQLAAHDRYEYDDERLEECLRGMRGEIRQIPPMYSALHHQGQRLYQLARQGIEVEREARPVQVYRLELLERERDENGRPRLTLEVSCSGGTYVRTLCHDIGAALGTGAVMSALCRLQSGSFTLEQSFSLAEIGEKLAQPEQWLLPLDAPLRDMPAIRLTAEEQVNALAQGKFLYGMETEEPPDTLCRLCWQERLVAIGKTALSARQEMMVRPVKVLI